MGFLSGMVIENSYKNKDMIKCGIYKITSPSGKIYIGQSIDIDTRWSQYKIISKSSGQKRLRNSFKSYGRENHIFEIIEECEEIDLNCRERYWQDFYDVTGENGLNIVLVQCEDKLRTTNTSIEVYDCFYMETFCSIKEAGRQTGLGEMYIQQRLKNKLHNDGRFMYKKDYNNNIFPKPFELKKYASVIDIETFVVFKTIDLAAEIHNIPCSTLKNYLDGIYENKTSLRYLEENRILKKNPAKSKRVIDHSDNIIYDSISDAAKATGINRCSLKGYLNGKVKNKTTLEFYYE